MRTLALALMLAMAVSTAHAQDAPEDRALFERFVAPCCWTESLATHDSPLARSLREEITARLDAGEGAAVIERDLVARHGERIRAEPAVLETVSVALYAALLAAALALVVVGIRWQSRASAVVEAARPAGPEDDQLDRRLEEELARVID